MDLTDNLSNKIMENFINLIQRTYSKFSIIRIKNNELLIVLVYITSL